MEAANLCNYVIFYPFIAPIPPKVTGINLWNPQIPGGWWWDTNLWWSHACTVVQCSGFNQNRLMPLLLSGRCYCKQYKVVCNHSLPEEKFRIPPSRTTSSHVSNSFSCFFNIIKTSNMCGMNDAGPRGIKGKWSEKEKERGGMRRKQRRINMDRDVKLFLAEVAAS